MPSPGATSEFMPGSPGADGGTAAFLPGQDSEAQGTESEHRANTVSIPGYEIEGVLGRGGMGVVYKARHLALKRTVALKMVLAGGHAGPEELARFRIEAEAVARLQHPNIVQIHEVGEANGHPYFALEFVEGGSLDQRLNNQPLPAPEAARLVQALAQAMQLAHSRNVVHRDLKPANVLLTSDGTPKITDFGLARQTDRASSETQAGSVMGTPSYMAPEQASGHAHEAGPAADVYALGAILYACLSGRPPFQGKTVVDTLDQVRTQEPAPPSRLRSSVPLDLETICLKCLRKEPDQRYASAQALAEDLRSWQAGEPISARPVGRLERTSKWARRNPGLALLGAAVILLVVTVTIGAIASALSFRHLAGKEREQATAARNAEQEADLARKEAIKDAEAARLAQAAAVKAQKLAEIETERANREAETAKEVTKFMSGLLEETDPLAFTGRSFGARKQDEESQVIARKLLDRGVENLKTKLKDKPGVRAALLDKIGTIYLSFGETARAKPLLEEALQLRRAEFGEHHADVATSWQSLGYLHAVGHDKQKAVDASQKALAIRTKLFGEDHPLTAETMIFFAASIGAIDAEAGEKMLHKAIDINRRHFGKESRQYAIPLLMLAQSHVNRGEYLQALPVLDEGAALIEKLEGKKGLAAAVKLYIDSQTSRHLFGDKKTALRLCQECAERVEPLMGEMHWMTLQVRNELAELHLNLGDFKNAEKEYRLLLDRHGEAFGENSIELTSLLMNLGRVHRDAKRYPEAEEVLRRAVKVGRSATGPPISQDFQRSLTILGAVLTFQKKFVEAEPVLEEAVAARRTDADVKNLFWLGYDTDALVWTLLQNGKRARAADVYRENLPTLAKQTKPKREHLLSMVFWQAHFCGLNGADPKALTPKEQDEFRHSADAAMASLHAAVAAGFRDVKLLHNAPELASIRGRKDFQALVQKLAAE